MSKTQDPAASPAMAGGEQGDDRQFIRQLRRQQILSQFGVLALSEASVDSLYQSASNLIVSGLGATHSLVLEYNELPQHFIVRAGYGWPEDGAKGEVVNADTIFPAGYAFQTGLPGIADFSREGGFRRPPLLEAGGILSAASVVLRGPSHVFGVIEAESRQEGFFNLNDLPFLEGIANLLGMAIERHRMERDLKAALAQKEHLLKEVNHRIKNSIQLVSSLLTLQASRSKNDDVKTQLLKASNRIAAIAKVHQRLYRGDEIGHIDLGAYFTELCSDLVLSTEGSIAVECKELVRLATDQVVPLALIVNELITNAAKNAHPNRKWHGWLHVTRESDASIVLVFRDDGIGLPDDFEFGTGSGLGTHLILSLLRQIGGEISIQKPQVGAEFHLRFRPIAH